MTGLSSSLKFIMFFLVLVLGISVVFGSKVATWFAGLVLLSMAVTNADLFTSILNKMGSLGTTQTAPAGKVDWGKYSDGGVMV